MYQPLCRRNFIEFVVGKAMNDIGQHFVGQTLSRESNFTSFLNMQVAMWPLPPTTFSHSIMSNTNSSSWSPGGPKFIYRPAHMSEP